MKTDKSEIGIKIYLKKEKNTPKERSYASSIATTNEITTKQGKSHFEIDTHAHRSVHRHRYYSAVVVCTFPVKIFVTKMHIADVNTIIRLRNSDCEGERERKRKAHRQSNYTPKPTTTLCAKCVFSQDRDRCKTKTVRMMRAIAQIV